MGDWLLNFYKNRIGKESKISFYSAVIIGLLVHAYKFTNTLPCHDTVYNYYSSQNVIASGRWFLTLACGFSSYFDLPWVIGLLSLLFIALTAVIVVDVLKITNPSLIVLTSGILVSSPAATQTFFFGYTSDGYMLAMLLSAFAVWLTQEHKISKAKILLAILCICFSIASYQAHLSFALCLAICYFCLKLLANCFSPKQIWKWITAQAVVFSGGTALYYVMWKILMRIEQVKPTEYLGIDKVSFNLSVVKGGFARAIESILLYFLECNVLKSGWTLYAVLNMIFVLCALLAIVAVVYKTGIYKNKLNFVLFLTSLAVMPFAACILSFAAYIFYGARMLFSLSLIYIFIAVLWENYFLTKSKNIFAALLFVIVFRGNFKSFLI